jgi:hypothetical protein
MTRLNGHAKAALASLSPNEPMVPKRAYDRVLHELIETKDTLRRVRSAKCQIEETLAQERQIHAIEMTMLSKRERLRAEALGK